MNSTKRLLSNLGSAIAFGALTVVLIVSVSNAQNAFRLTASSTNVNPANEAVRIDLMRWSTDEERNLLVAALSGTPPRPERSASDNTDPFGTFRGGQPVAADAPAAASGQQAAAAPAAPAAAAPARGGRGNRGGGAAPPPPDPIKLFTENLVKAPTLGYLWTTENGGYSIKYAHRNATPDGGERIVLVTNRTLSWKPTGATTTPNPYEFTVIEMRLDSKGAGQGKASLTSKVVVDGETKTIGLENYATAPAVLTSIKK